MSKRFNAKKKQFIRDALIEKGKELFSQYGLQKTSIQEITKSVGIAQGTFYNFFPSKEELYFIILEREEKNIHEKLSNVDLHNDEQPKETIKKLLKELVHHVETNPLLQELYVGNNLQQMMRTLSTETIDQHIAEDTSTFALLLKDWEKKGIVLTKEPEVIGGLLRSLFVLTIHPREIGETVYKETIDLFIDLIVEGIIKEG